MGMPIQQVAKTSMDGLAVAAMGGSLLDILPLPEVAAGFTIVWLGMQMIIYWPQVKERLKKIFKRGDN